MLLQYNRSLCYFCGCKVEKVNNALDSCVGREPQYTEKQSITFSAEKLFIKICCSIQCRRKYLNVLLQKYSEQKFKTQQKPQARSKLFEEHISNLVH